MPHHHERKALPYSAAQMYDLVTDVRRYAEFLPWVAAVRVRSDSETEMLADLVVGFKALKETFSSRVLKTPQSKVMVDYLDGPMRHLHNQWLFEETADGCIVDFTVDFAFQNRIFEALAGQYFSTALRKMTDAFVARAEVLYGDGSKS
jgi:coenzyme Q-binding protein COQ10